eukprot:1703067-Rhodomonas_salina.2
MTKAAQTARVSAAKHVLSVGTRQAEAKVDRFILHNASLKLAGADATDIVTLFALLSPFGAAPNRNKNKNDKNDKTLNHNKEGSDADSSSNTNTNRMLDCIP